MRERHRHEQYRWVASQMLSDQDRTCHIWVRGATRHPARSYMFLNNEEIPNQAT